MFPAEPLSGYLQQNKDRARHQRSRPRVDLCQDKALLRHHVRPPPRGDTEMSLCSCRCFHRAFVALTWPWKVCAIQSWALIAGYLRPPPSPLWCLEMDVVKRNLLSKDKKNPLFTGKIGFTQYSSVLQWPAWFLGKFFISNTYHYPTRIATQALTSGFTVKVILLVLLYLKYIILIHQGVTDPLASDHKYTQIWKKKLALNIPSTFRSRYIFAALPCRYKTLWVMWWSSNPSRLRRFITGASWEVLIIYTQCIAISCSWDIFQVTNSSKVSWL